MRKRRRKHKSYSKRFLILVLLILLIIIINKTFARYGSSGSSKATVDVALFLLEETVISENISLTQMVPGDKNTYTFSISNYNDEGKMAEVAIEYEIKIRMTTNLPLEYELYENENSINLLSNADTVSDANGTYFITKKLEKEYFKYDENQKNLYTLKVIFPDNYKSSEYQGIIDAIEITVEAKQRR